MSRQHPNDMEIERHCDREKYRLRAHARLAVPLVLLLGGSAFLMASAASAAERRQMQLTLRQATALALQNNLNIQIAGLTPRIREAQVTEQQGIFDVELRGGFTTTDRQLLDTSNSVRLSNDLVVENGVTLAGREDTELQELSLGAQQLTPYGGTYEVDVLGSREQTNRRLIPNFDTGNTVELYTTDLQLRYTQPILKNFGSDVTRNQILIAQNNLTISTEEFRQQVIDSTSQVQQTYWELVFRRQDLQVRRQQLDLAEQLLTRVRRQVEVGTLAPIEVLQAETEIARIREEIIIAANAVHDAEDRLKRAMYLSLVGEFANVEILPTDPPTYSAPQIDQAAEIAEALAQRPDLKQAQLTLDNQNITLVFNQNQILPTLDIAASLRFNGINDSVGRSLGEFDTNRREWAIGLAFSYPLANRQAKSRVRQSRLAIRQQLLRIKELEENVMEDVRRAVRGVLASSELVHASKAASRLAQKQLDAEEKKLKVGLATVFTVLQFQEDLAVERSNEIRSLTQFLQARVNLEAVKSTLLQTNDIVIESNGPQLR
jgi:outer membrane protein